MRQLIAFESDREVKIEVARLGKGKIKELDQAERIVLTVPRKKRKTIGIEMAFSSIVAIQEKIHLPQRLESLKGKSCLNSMANPLAIRLRSVFACGNSFVANRL